MAESTDRRPGVLAGRWAWCVRVALAVYLTVGAGTAHAQDAGYAVPEADTTDDGDADKRPERSPLSSVHFEDLGVIDDQGRLVVDYEVARKDWTRMEKEIRALWIQLWVRNGSTNPPRWISHALPLEEREGRRQFPRWLTTDAGTDVGACLLGTGLGDNLVYGRGYTCVELARLSVEEERPDSASQKHTFRMQYRAGPPYIPYAPWVEPRVPDFQGPFDQLPAP